MNIIASLVLYKHTFHELESTLTSLLNEKTIDKLVIVDNGSFCEWLREYHHPKVDVIRLPDNQGFGAGHNKVFLDYQNKCDFFLICNPDIYYSHGEVDKLFNFCKDNDVDLSVPRIIYPTGTLQYATKLLPAPFQLFGRRFLSSFIPDVNHKYELRDADFDAAFFAPSMSGCFMLVSSKAMTKVIGFDLRFFMYLEDVDFSRRISAEDLNVVYCPFSTVVHLSQRKSYRNLKFFFFHVISAMKYFNKWGWFFDSERRRLNQRCLSSLPEKIKK